ncbi:YbaB/EbfC family nucleoid-associated protein [Candidatus Uhrbacteria bacterium]|nr:YbaB/EbfC family nucleoid-associated protein [Candidatus Uhrbacteria bacterium]
MFSKLKAIKDLRSQAKQMQSTMEQISETGSGAGGRVQITMNGNMHVVSVEIADDLMNDKNKLTAGVKDAISESLKGIQKKIAEHMKNNGKMQEMLKNLGM